jgi:hypothetical protein
MPKTKLARKMSPQLLQRILADLAADSKKAKPTMSEAERKFATVFFLSLGDNNTFANKANFSENIAVGKETAKQEDWAPYNNKELAQESAQLLGKTQKLFAAVKLADKAPKQIRGAAYNPNENKNVLAVHLNDILNQGAINRKKVSLSPTSTPEAFDQIHAQLREIRTATRDATPAQIAQAITENKANHQEYNNAIEEQQVALARADFESKRPKPLNLSDAMMEQRPALETKNSPTVSGRRSPSYFEQGLFHDVSAVKRVLKNDEDVHFFQKMEKFAVIIQHNFSAKSEETVLRKHTDSDKTNFDSKLQSDLVTIGHLLWDQRPAQVEAKSAAAIASRETVHRGIVDIMREANLIATVLELQREGPVKLASNAPSDRLAGNANSQFNFTDLLETLKSSSDINTPAQVQAMINKLDVFKAAMGYTSAPALGEKDIIPGLTEAQTEVIRKLEGDQLRLKKQEYPAEFAQITPPKPVNVLKASSDAISVPEPIEIKQTNVTPPLITPIFVPFQAPGPTGVVKASDAIVAAPEKAEYVSPPKFSVSEIIEPAVQPVVEQKIDVNEANKDDLHAGEKLDQSDLNDLPPIPEETKDDIAQELDDDNQYDNEGFAEFKDESTQEEQKDEVIEEEASLEDVVAEEENVVLPIPSTLPPINPASDPFDAIAAQMLGLENNIQVSSAEILKHQTDTDNFDIFFSNPTNIAAATGKLKDYKEQLESIHEQITQLEEQDIAIPSHITKQLNETQIAYDNLAGLIKNAQEHSIQPQELTDSDSELELEEDELQIEQNDNVVIPVTPAQQQVVLEQNAEELVEEEMTQSLFDPDAPDLTSTDIRPTSGTTDTEEKQVDANKNENDLFLEDVVDDPEEKADDQYANDTFSEFDETEPEQKEDAYDENDFSDPNAELAAKVIEELKHIDTEVLDIVSTVDREPTAELITALINSEENKLEALTIARKDALDVTPEVLAVVREDLIYETIKNDIAMAELRIAGLRELEATLIARNDNAEVEENKNDDAEIKLPPINPASDPFDVIAAQMIGLESSIQVSSTEILSHQIGADNFDTFFSDPTNIAIATDTLKDYEEQLESIREQITQLEEQDFAIPSHITKQLNETQIAYDNLAGLIKNAQEHSIQPQELTDSDSELELEEDELQIEQNDNVVIPVTPAQQQVVLEQDAEELPEEQVTQSLFDPDAPDTESKDEQVVSTAKRKEDDDFTPVEPLVMTDFEDDEAKIIPQVPVVADNNEDDLYADDEFDQPENSNVLPPIPEETEEEIAQELDDDNQYDNEGFAEFKDESKQEEQKDEVIEEDASLEDVVAEEENVVLPIPSTLPPISVRKDIDTLSNDIIQLHLAINMSKKEIPVTQVAFDELISQYQTDIDILEARVKERDDEDITAAFEETKKDFEILKTLFKPPVNELDDVDDGFNPVDPLVMTDFEDDEQKHNVLPSISEETEEDIAEELDEDNEAELPNSSTFILPSSLIIDDDLLEEESDYDDSNTSSPISSTVTSPISSRPSTPGSPTTPTSPTTSKPSDIDLKSLLDRIAQKLHIRGNVQNFQAMHHVDKMLAIEVNIEHAREIGDTDSFKNWVHHLNNLHPPIEHIAQIMATFTAELQEVFDNNPKNATPEQMALVEKYRSLDDMSHQIQEEQLTFYKMDIAAVIGPEESDQACLNRLLGAMGDKLAGQVSQAGSAIMADPSFDEKTTKMLTETTRRIGIKCVAAVPDNLTIAAKKDFIAENSAIFRTERTQTNAVRVTMTFPNDLQPHLFLVNPAQKFGLVDNTFNPTLAGATPKGWPEIVKEMLVSFAMQKIPPSEQAMKTWLTQNGSGPGGNKNYNFGGGTMFSSAESNIAKELAKVYNEKMYSPEARQKFDVMAIHQIQEWLSARGINSDNKEHMSRISVPLPSGDPAYVQSFVNVCAAMGVNPNRLPGYTVTPGSAASIQREIETQQMKDNPTMTKFSPSIENHRWRAPDTAKMQAGYTQGVLETSLHQKDQLAQSPIPAAIQITPTTTPPSRSRITGHPPPPVKTVQSLASQLHLQPARIAPESQKVDSPKSESSGPGLGGLGKAK